MKRTHLTSFAFTILLLVNAPAWADDDISFSDLPQVVQEAAMREVGNGVITEVEIDKEPFGLIYEIEFVRDGVEYETDITERGRVIRTKRD